MSLSDNSLAGVSFEDLVKQMPKEFKDRFSEINKHLIENDVCDCCFIIFLIENYQRYAKITRSITKKKQ